jgi:hypothetical protein
VKELDLLRRIATSKLPFRLLTPEDFGAAESLRASGYVKVSLPMVRNSKSAYGKQEDALVSAITPAGRRALGSLVPARHV